MFLRAIYNVLNFWPAKLTSKLRKLLFAWSLYIGMAYLCVSCSHSHCVQHIFKLFKLWILRKSSGRYDKSCSKELALAGVAEWESLERNTTTLSEQVLSFGLYITQCGVRMWEFLASGRRTSTCELQATLDTSFSGRKVFVLEKLLCILERVFCGVRKIHDVFHQCEHSCCWSGMLSSSKFCRASVPLALQCWQFVI